MPHSKSLSHYPAAYAAIVRECSTQGKQKILSFDSLERAMKIRGHFYAYIGVLKAEGRRLRNLNSRTTGEDDILELANLAEMVMVTVEQEATEFRLVWQNRENSWQARELQRIVTKAGSSRPTEPQLDSIEQRLLQAQQEVKDGSR